jgi:hypothetical protein
MKTIIKLTTIKNEQILIGVPSIISVQSITMGENKVCTKIQSRGAMISTFYVNESVEGIYNLINSKK